MLVMEKGGDGEVDEIDNDQDDDNESDDHNHQYIHQNSDETHIETLSPEDEMEAAEGNDDLTDNEFLTIEEWREVVITVEFGRENGSVADDNSIDDEAAYPVDDATQDKDMIDESIWLDDTGASAHMTMSLQGMYDLR